MPPKLELTGQRFGRLTVLGEVGKDTYGAYLWLCSCDCGARPIIRGSQLKIGVSESCGCGGGIATSERQTTHGMSGSPLYQRWRAMRDRTSRSGNTEYRNYGGRGISVCDRWSSFEKFAEDMGSTFRRELELDRIDVYGDYTPENCRWMTHTAQQRNKRTNHILEWNGRSRSVQEWAELLDIKANTIIHRLRRGWSVERALTKGAGVVLLRIANMDDEQ